MKIDCEIALRKLKAFKKKWHLTTLQAFFGEISKIKGTTLLVSRKSLKSMRVYTVK